jgi:hypothetical protein
MAISKLAADPIKLYFFFFSVLSWVILQSMIFSICNKRESLPAKKEKMVIRPVTIYKGVSSPSINKQK